MKKQYLKLIIPSSFLIMSLLFVSCGKDFLNLQPIGPTSQETLATPAGINGLLIGAYSILTGWGGPDLGGGPYSESASDWVFGGIAGGDALKGSTDNDQTAIASIENYTVNSTNSYLRGKWGMLYTGVQRANDVIRELALLPAGAMPNAQISEIKAEAVFLRAFFTFNAAKMWKNVPYVDETIDYQAGNYNVPNTAPIWPLLEKDFRFAMDSLNVTQSDAGRANSWAAAGFLAKVYMFEHNYTAAKSILDSIIEYGVTDAGQKFALLPDFLDNFNPADKNNTEAVFSIQMTVQDGSGGQKANPGDILNFPNGGPTGCCGFYDPSFSLVNSFKTDPATGLPLFNTFDNSDITNDQGLNMSQPFTPYPGTVDPRLDWTVGRRGIPYLDWGLMSSNWVRDQDQDGPYIPRKNQLSQAQQATYGDVAFGWGTNQGTAINYEAIRFSGILLLDAEADVELGNLDQAEQYVNMVRARASNSTYWVHTYIDNNNPTKGFTNIPAADYKIGLYAPGQFQSMGQDYAREAVRFERKLELAMEGHRFFDLQRWDNGTGYMADVLNAYLQHESHVPGFVSSIITPASKFTKGVNEIYPIPQTQIDLSVRSGVPILKQNPGYN